MSLHTLAFFVLCLIAHSLCSWAQEADKTAPNVTILQPGVQLTLLAEHPDLVTPTGIDLDPQGNLWVVACHTHFRPASYQGPENDEILVFDPAGKNRRVFYNKTKTTMQLLAGPDGWLYVAQRDRILRVKDSDNDGIGDTQEPIVSLDTLADYAQWPERDDLAYRWWPGFLARRKLWQGLDASWYGWQRSERSRRGRCFSLQQGWQKTQAYRQRVLESVRIVDAKRWSSVCC